MFVAHSDRPFECCATEPAYPAFAHEGTGLPLGANLGEAVPMSETVALLDILRQSTDADMVRSIKRLIDEAPDRALSRINVFAFADATGLDSERVTAAIVHAARL